MLWDEVNKVQGYRWIDILPAFVLAYNKAPHEAHKKSLYEAFFGFKMRGVYATPTMQVNESGETTLTAAQVDESGETTPSGSFECVVFCQYMHCSTLYHSST